MIVISGNEPGGMYLLVSDTDIEGLRAEFTTRQQHVYGDPEYSDQLTEEGVTALLRAYTTCIRRSINNADRSEVQALLAPDEGITVAVGSLQGETLDEWLSRVGSPAIRALNQVTLTDLAVVM